MLYVLFTLLVFWLVCNTIVFIKWSPPEMYTELVKEQNVVGRICGNAFYLPCWIVKFLVYFVWHWLKKLGALIRYVWFAILRFLQEIYHSIFDIL